MDALECVAKELYTNFVLRDFLGNIVPGAFLLFSFCAMFLPPSELLKLISGKISVVLISILGGIAWIASLALHVFTGFFWPSFVSLEDINQQKACIDAITYERFIVIGQSAKHWLNSIFFAIPAWLIFFSTYLRSAEGKSNVYGSSIAKVRTALVLSIAVLFILGLSSRLSLHGTDITRQQAQIHPVDPDQKGGIGWLAGDWDDFADLATPTFHRVAGTRADQNLRSPQVEVVAGGLRLDLRQQKGRPLEAADLCDFS